MDENGISRRQVLALLAAAGGTAALSATRPWDDSPTDTETETPASTEAPASAGTPQSDSSGSEVETSVRLEEHGAAVDGETDDTDALMSALDAASPDGSVRLPAGDILVGSDRDIAIPLGHRHRGVSILGAGPGRTRLKMTPGHNSVHRGIVISPGQQDELSGITIRDLTFDGQGVEQNFNIANGIEVEQAGGVGFPLEIRNCVIRDWATNGLQLREPGTRIYDSSIVQNGRKQEEMTGRDGHGVSAAIGDNPNDETVIDGCLLSGNTGAGADNSGGNMTITGCVIDSCGYGVKQNQTTRKQVIENTLISNLKTEPGLYNIPPDTNGGDLVLDTVCIENATDPGLLFPAGGSISGDNIVIRHTNTDQTQPAGVVVKDEGRRFDVGRLTVVDTTGGSALYLQNCTGSIERLVHTGNDDGVGPLSDVSVGEVLEEQPTELDLPEIGDVGAEAYFGSFDPSA